MAIIKTTAFDAGICYEQEIKTKDTLLASEEFMTKRLNGSASYRLSKL